MLECTNQRCEEARLYVLSSSRLAQRRFPLAYRNVRQTTIVLPVQAICGPLARLPGRRIRYVTCVGRVSDPSCSTCRNALDGLIKIARTEGPAQLWRGTDLSLAVCVPAIAVYFPLYEHALQHLQSAGNARRQPSGIILCPT